MNEGERFKSIMDILYQEDLVSSEKLEKILGVSSVTIRRDLQKLTKKGLIVRYRGGAMLAKSKLGHEPTLGERESENLSNKRLIGQTAASLVKDGEVIALDVGSTAMELAKALKARSNITVFTPSLPIANIFLNTNVTVYIVGGILQHKEVCVGGPIARSIIRQYHFDKFFLGVAGISETAGMTDFGMDEVETKKAFIERAREVIVLADSSKFSKTSFATICKFNEIDQIITDYDLDSQPQANLKKKGVDIVVASCSED